MFGIFSDIERLAEMYGRSEAARRNAMPILVFLAVRIFRWRVERQRTPARFALKRGALLLQLFGAGSGRWRRAVATARCLRQQRKAQQAPNEAHLTFKNGQYIYCHSIARAARARLLRRRARRH